MQWHLCIIFAAIYFLLFIFGIVLYVLYSLHCSLCTVVYALYSLAYIIYLLTVLYSLHCIFCNMFYAFYSMHGMDRILCIVQCALYSLHCIICIVFNALNAMNCAVCIRWVFPMGRVWQYSQYKTTSSILFYTSRAWNDSYFINNCKVSGFLHANNWTTIGFYTS